MTDKKKFVKSVERKGGMIEVKNTGKGQAQGQAVKINIKIGDTKAQKEKKEKEEKKAKKRRATKRAKKKLIEQIQEDLKLIQNLKLTAKDRGIAIPAELGALPISVPTDMKGLIALQKEMSERVVAIQQYIQSQSETSETAQVQPQIIRGTGVPAPPIQFQEELIKSRQRIQELTPGFVPTQPVDESAKQKEIDDAKKRLKELSDRARKKREDMLNPTQPVIPDDTTKLIDDLLTGNIRKMKKQLQERVKKGELKQEEADRLLQEEIDRAKQEEDTAISASIGETERKEFEELEKEKREYENRLKQVADKIIKEAKARKSNFYTIDKKDVDALDVMRENQLVKSQDYQRKYGLVIGENPDIFGDFFRQSDILYQPNNIRQLLRAFISEEEKDLKEQVEVQARLSILQIKEQLSEISMLYDDINKDINETVRQFNGRATPDLVERVQNGLKTANDMIDKVAEGNMTGDSGKLIETTLNKMNRQKRGKITGFLKNIMRGTTQVVPAIPINPTKELALKRLKEYIAMNNDIDPKKDYTTSGFADLIGNKNLWDLIMREPTKRLKYSNLQSQLDQWISMNPEYEEAPLTVPPIQIPPVPRLEKVEPDFDTMPIPPDPKQSDLADLLSDEKLREQIEKRNRERQRQKQEQRKPKKKDMPPPAPKKPPKKRDMPPKPKRPEELTPPTPDEPLFNPFDEPNPDAPRPPRQQRVDMKTAKKMREADKPVVVNFGEPKGFLEEQ
tara:strand:- start:879 stop:3083 length:2205 start_codon:yes stop_codon:yes gene_type:complete